MLSVSSSIDVPRSIDDVFAYVGDLGTYHDWQRNLITAEVLSDGPVGVGTTLRFTRRFMGREMINQGQVVGFDPPHDLAYRVDAGAFKGHSGIRCAGADGSTQVTMYFEGQANGIFKAAEGILAGQLEKLIQSNLDGLKAVLES